MMGTAMITKHDEFVFIICLVDRHRQSLVLESKENKVTRPYTKYAG